MRCGECEAAGLVEPCFCPCCGRPLASLRPIAEEEGPAEAPPPSHACGSCGAPSADGRELCDGCEETFQRVLHAVAPDSPPASEADADTPTMIVAPWSVGPAFDGSVTSEPVDPDTTFVEPAEPAPAAYACADGEPGAFAPVVAVAPWSVPDDPAASTEPKPWWEMSTPVTAEPAVEEGPPPEPVACAVPSPAETLTRPVPPPIEVAPRAQAAPDPPTRQFRPPRPARVPAAAGRARRASPARLVAVALGAAAVCSVAFIGMPHLFDLTWRAPVASPAPADPPATDVPPATPLPDTSALVPATDPSAPPPAAPAATAPPPAAAAPATTPAADSKKPARTTARADATRAARLLQQRAAAAARPAPAAAPVEVPMDLPTPIAVAPSPATAPPPVAEAIPIGQAFEVTQVDVRPQVTRQVSPRRPDNGKAADVVVVRVLVSPAGRAADVRVVRGAKGAAAYDAAAIEAVRQWSFTPAQKRSRPVSCWVHVGVPFAAEGEGQ